MGSAGGPLRPGPRAPRLGVATLLALLAWSGLLLQLWLSLRLALGNGKSLVEGLLIYLGYFTVLSNLFVALVLTLPAMAPATRLGLVFARPSLQACAATSIALVGLGYHLLLRQVWDPQGLQWLADMLLHYAMPLLFSAYWLWAAPKNGLRWWMALAACLYPLLYFGAVLLRGALGGGYPYHFIDVGVIGYGQACRHGLGLLLAFVVLGLLFQALGRLMLRYRAQRPALARP